MTTTFDGAAGKDGLLGMPGDAKGASIAIIDDSNNLIALGKPSAGQLMSAGASETPLLDITEGDRALNYSLRLVSNQQQLRSGEYTSIIRFKMDHYQLIYIKQ